jgi:hypothetical protein
MIGPFLLSMTTRRITPYIRVQATLSHPAWGQALMEILVPAALVLVIQYEYEMYTHVTGNRDRMTSTVFLKPLSQLLVFFLVSFD